MTGRRAMVNNPPEKKPFIDVDNNVQIGKALYPRSFCKAVFDAVERQKVPQSLVAATYKIPSGDVHSIVMKGRYGKL